MLIHQSEQIIVKDEDYIRKRPFLERWATRKIKKQLLKDDIKGLSKLTAFAVAFFIGFVATIPIVYFDYYMDSAYPIDFHEYPLEYMLKLGVLGISIVLFSIVEIYLLYNVTFRLFIDLYKKYNVTTSVMFDYDISYSFYSVMAKIALETDEEPINMLKADIYRRKNAHIHRATKLMYKAKTVLSNAIAKAILRRIFMKNGIRIGANYISAPITGLWDAVVLYFVAKKMEFILKSTIIIDDYLKEKEKIFNECSDRFYEATVRLISNAVSEQGEYHPNFKYLLSRILNKEKFVLDFNYLKELGDENYLKESLYKLNKSEKYEALELITLIDKISRKNSINFKNIKLILIEGINYARDTL